MAETTAKKPAAKSAPRPTESSAREKQTEVEPARALGDPPASVAPGIPPSPNAAEAARRQAAADDPPEEVAPQGDPEEGDLTELSTEDLMHARDTINRVLSRRQAPSAQEVGKPTLLQRAYDLPSNEKAAEELDAASAAKKAGIEEEDVLAYRVRQSTNADGKPIGEGILIVIDKTGVKHPVEL